MAHATGQRFEVATVDHNLRSESAAEAAQVAEICARLGVKHRILDVCVPASGNLQAEARAARYGTMAAWMQERGLAALATAHHADDQAETLIMRLNRGAGVRGLAGMRTVSPLPGAPDLPLIRPLLHWRRAELAAIVAASGFPATDDPSNRKDSFERVRIRNALGETDWLNSAALAQAAHRLADADEVLVWASEREWVEAVAATDRLITYQPAAPRAIRLRVLERIVTILGQNDPRGSEVSRWLTALEEGRTATLAGVKGVSKAGIWHFSPVPSHRH